MSLKILITVCLVIVSSNSATDQKECPENEVPTDCVHPCSPTCTRPFVTCNSDACLKGCSCKQGHIRTRDGGPCVAMAKCGKHCDKNQEYTDCGSACPNLCLHRKPACTDGCVQGCYCKKGYIYMPYMRKCISFLECAAASV